MQKTISWFFVLDITLKPEVSGLRKAPAPKLTLLQSVAVCESSKGEISSWVKYGCYFVF